MRRGRAQITQGYTEQDAEAYGEKLRWNDRYAAALSLREDLRILACTLLWMLQAKGWRPSQTPDNVTHLDSRREGRRAG